MKSYRLTEILLGTFVVLIIFASILGAVFKMDWHFKGYELVGYFERIDGIVPGSDVRLSGIKVGSVTSVVLDKKNYQAKVAMKIYNVDIPTDSEAEIVSASLMGEKYVSLIPGSDEENLSPGSEIAHTQSAMNLEHLLMRYFLNSAEGASDKKPEEALEKQEKESPKEEKSGQQKESGEKNSLDVKGEGGKEGAKEKRNNGSNAKVKSTDKANAEEIDPENSREESFPQGKADKENKPKNAFPKDTNSGEKKDVLPEGIHDESKLFEDDAPPVTQAKVRKGKRRRSGRPSLIRGSQLVP
jgi:phospholipid/cholesterol/gamma-HCH transport system substrate-binding protein